MHAVIYWNPDRVLFTLPWIEWPVMWYGFFFALGILFTYFLASRRIRQLEYIKDCDEKKQSIFIDRLAWYLILGALAGARLGDVIFYQQSIAFVDLFNLRQGGLASHGAGMGLLLALWIFCRRSSREYPEISYIDFLDLLSVPVLFAAGCIRIGNFFNQEILGKVSDLPWSVFFAHPLDGSIPAARHPVQIYEALFYFIIFLVLFYFSYFPQAKAKGRLSCLFLVGVFSFRFFIEFLKVPQSDYIDQDAFFLMGQYLSIPYLVLALILWKSRIFLDRLHKLSS